MSAADPRFRSSWHAWRALRWRERFVFLQLAVLLRLVEVALRLAGFARVRAACDRIAGRGPFRAPSDTELADAHRLAELAAIAGRHGPMPATCLRQALVVATLLRRRGLDAQIRIGVLPDAKPFTAHAWVELGEAALGPNPTEFAVLEPPR